MSERSHPIYQMSKEQVLIASLEKEYGFYQSILELILEEQDILKSKRRLNEMSKIARKRKILFSFIEEIELALKPLKIYWQQKKGKEDRESQKIARLFKNLQQIVEQILLIDQQNHQSIQDHLSSLKPLAHKLR